MQILKSYSCSLKRGKSVAGSNTG